MLNKASANCYFLQVFKFTFSIESQFIFTINFLFKIYFSAYVKITFSNFSF